MSSPGRRCTPWQRKHPALEELHDHGQRLLHRRAMPDFTPLMLATLSATVFSDPAWVSEAKLDGQRSLLWKKGSTVRLITRNEKDRTSHYPDLRQAAARETRLALIADGEIVAFRGDVTSFSRLQGRMQDPRPSPSQVGAVPVFFYLFDLVWFEGYDLSALPLLARKPGSDLPKPCDPPLFDRWPCLPIRASTPAGGPPPSSWR